MPTRVRARLGRGALVPAALNLVGIGAMTAPAITGLPLAVDLLAPATERTGILALAVTLGAVAATVTNPLFGALSDRTRSRLGARHPWIIGGSVFGLASMGLLLVAPSIGILLTAWVLVQVSYNALLAGAAGLLADAVPDAERGRASGAFSAAAFLGTVPPLLLSSLLPDHVGTVTLAMSLLAVAVAVGAAAALPARAVQATQAQDAEPGGIGSVRRFAPVWASRFIQSVAFGLVTSFMLYLVADRITGTAGAATALTSLSTLAGGAAIVGAALTVGWVADRIDPRILLAGSALLLACAALLRAGAASAPTLVLSAVLGGISMGLFLAVNLTAALRRIPVGAGGRYLGALNIADTLPQIVVPSVAAWLLTLGGPDPISGAADNFTSLCVGAAVVSLAGLAVLPFLRPARAEVVGAGANAGPDETPRGERA
ncbi:MFS transporter [Microbacterium sp. NPDC076895]|uniref:MFS transporter n=1 Tax=Microbacterium sp. NPDC076895 TaxID=3154957 RepID=UPI00341BA911